MWIISSHQLCPANKVNRYDEGENVGGICLAVARVKLANEAGELQIRDSNLGPESAGIQCRQVLKEVPK